MPTFTDQAIVLRVWEFSETSQTVSLLTQNHGIIRGLAKGAKREKSMFSGGFEPTTVGELTAIVKPSAELATLTEWSLSAVHHHLRADLRAQYAALYCVDLVGRLFESADPHPVLFAALDHVLVSLATRRVDAELTRFLWCLLSEAGYCPRIGESPSPIATTIGFNSATAELVPDPGPGHSSAVWRVRGETIELLARLNREIDDPLEDVAPDVLRRAARLLAAYLNTHLAREPPTQQFVLGDMNEK